MRQATVLVADELTYSVSGKMSIIGIYTGDIFLPAPQAHVQQLVFIFIADCEPDDPFQRMELSVTFPSGDRRALEVPMQSLRLSLSDKIRWTVRQPFLIQNVVLSPGQILAKITHEKGEILVHAPVITVMAAQNPIAASAT
jgi:hypothetical protein